ncbi:MAG: MBL fold metallo-hydrolase [Phycisphaerae bacterium]
MKITHVRNATLILEMGELVFLVDPMFSEPGTLPGFRMRGGPKRKNPLVPLPGSAMDWMERVQGVLISHEHPDHLDPPAVAWINARALPVWAGDVDLTYLKSKGLDARRLDDLASRLDVEMIPAQHGRGLIGWMMGPVSGFYLRYPGEPTVYLTGDTVLTPIVRTAIKERRPDVIVAPAGSANFGIGKDILLTREEHEELVQIAPGVVVFNHLEAIDHCPTTRADLRQRIDQRGWGDRVFIPQDGETMHFSTPADSLQAAPKQQSHRIPSFQKWLTSKIG